MMIQSYDSSPVLRDTRLFIDLDALRDNYRTLKALVGPRVAIAGVVKANAYGLGAPVIARALHEEGIDYLGVANLLEAVALRQSGEAYPLFVMGHTPDESLETGVAHQITLTIFSLHQARILEHIALESGTTVKVHLKINTGFNRLGLSPTPESGIEIAEILKLPHLEVEGIFTHLALCSPEEDQKQLRAFKDFLGDLGASFDLVHVADSISGIDYPDFRLDMIRPGAALYGLKSYHSEDIHLRPVARFVTRVSHLNTLEPGEGVSYDFTFKAEKTTRIATLPVGYGDGYPRNLSNRGHVLIRGMKAPIVGIICMDQMMVDVTLIPGVGPGDEAVLFGEGLPVAELAVLAATNKNEILARLASRIPRIYLEGGRESLVLNEIL